MIKLALEKSTDGGCIQDLIRNGRKNGYITITKLMECLSPEITDQDQIEDIVSMIKEMGIEVKY